MTTRRLAIAVLACSCAADAALADFTTRRRPPAPDCASAVASAPTGSIWRGIYTGSLKSDINDKHYALFLEGCFPSEASCELWLQRAVTYAVGPTISLRCTPYG